ncbi:MAG: hypothetical protein FWC43_08290 [Planctomycetaceae bacterium]|nr:hypothetical protein [Planctomycetaceae bacterium]
MKRKTKKPLTPLKAIRAKCLDCCCNQAKEVRLCPCKNCPLYPYRTGKNPRRSKLSTSGQTVSQE